jgi:PAS domain S-box-containing protein
MHRVWAALMTAARYIVANVPVVVATALCTHWRFAWGDRVPLVAYAIAIALAAVACGAGPALLATGTSVAAVSYFFLPPRHELGVVRTIDQVHLLLLAANGVLVAMTTRYARCLRRRDALESLHTHELRRVGARVRRLWESNVIGVIHSDARGAILDANDGLLRMLGYAREDLCDPGLSWRTMTAPEHLARDDAAIAEAMMKGSCTPYEKTYFAKDGRRVPVLIGYALLEGSKPEFICFVIDLTAQKRAEAVLAEQITKAITDHASAALFMIDVEDGRCTFMNPAAEAMTGYSLSEIDHRPLHELIHHHHADGAPYPAAECELSRVATARGNPVEAREQVYFRRNGESFPALCTARRVDRPGYAPSVLLEVRDVTEVKRAAAEREMLLESERAARAEAERAARAKDELVAVVSHELRTPLSAVLGWADIARRRGQAEEQRDKALRIVERNARLLAQIMADILDVSRISTGKLHIERAPVDLWSVALAAVDSVRSAAEGKGVELITSIDCGELGGCVVLGDAPRLQQVVWNLLSNAIKFTPRGGHVRISVSATDDQARIVVRDDGQGIEPAFLPCVFDRFRQADASASRAQGGLGLGLSIVKHLVELHGGSVRAESEGLGRGACFTVELAREEAHPTAELDASTPGPFAELAHARVLVVDDEPDARELARRLLEERGAVVWTAASATEALDLLDERPVDAMVSDIGMPGVDGYELMRRVRAASRSVPAIALTAYARPEDAARALAAGYRAHLAKPYPPSKLLAAVAELVSPKARCPAS